MKALALVLVLATCSQIPAAAQPGVSLPAATLTLAGSRSHFYSGEPIVLNIAFRTPAANCFLVTSTSPSPMDSVELTPAAGVFRWQQGDGMGSDGASLSQVMPQKPAVIPLTLNDLFRFDAAGTYTVRVRTRHLQCGTFMHATQLELTTNAITFQVEPFPAAVEKHLAQSLEARIRAAKPDDCDADKLARQLDYLPGDDATQVKLSLFLHPRVSETYLPINFWIARNRPLVLGTLEQAISDPANEAAASLNFLDYLVELKRHAAEPEQQCCVLAMVPAGAAPTDHFLRDYLHQLALTLRQRTGDSRLEAAITLFEVYAPTGDNPHPATSPDYAVAREIVITRFADIDPYSVGDMLRRFGPALNDARLLPALQFLIAHSEGVFSSNRDDALKQLRLIASGSTAQPGPEHAQP